MTLVGHYNGLVDKFLVLVSHKTTEAQTHQNNADQTSHTSEAEI